jgi:hypothetical protein
MSSPRLPLFERLPEIYRLRDAEQSPPGQLEAYVRVFDDVMRAVRDHIEHLYHDQYIETCDDWVIPYIADLLGTTHLSGVPWTLRADVARTVFHRRRKGTLGAIESLSHTLTGWAAHAAEMRERLVWAQHLNHQRPDAGGVPPLSLMNSIQAAARGGTVTLRDPGLLSLVSGPFDPFAHLVDVKPPVEKGGGVSGFNLPNLAVFLWRLQNYRVLVSKPAMPAAPDDIVALTPAGPEDAAFAVRFFAHPMGEPMALFNTHRFHADDDPLELSILDAVPGPMPVARLSQDTPAGSPESYIKTANYTAAPPDAPSGEDPGLTLHIPDAAFPATQWKLRGANLCAWEQGLNPPLREYEIVIDPVRGRVLFGVVDEVNEAQILRDELLVSATYGYSGPTGAHPISRPERPTEWLDQVPTVLPVNYHTSATALTDLLANLPAGGPPLIIEIEDSMTHDLDIGAVIGSDVEGTRRVLRLGRSLWIRAVTGQRPVIRLARPLAFRPDVVGTDLEASLTVKLEGLYLTRGADFGAENALIEQAALHALIIEGCTLDPGGFIALDGTASGTRQPVRYAMSLTNDYGFSTEADEDAFEQKPEITITRSIVGPLAIDSDYIVIVNDSIIDALSEEEDEPKYAIRAVAGTTTANDWGPELTVNGVTLFGRTRVESVTGQGAIFVRGLEAHDNQKGCIKYSYFDAGDTNRLPPHHACVLDANAVPAFVSEFYGALGYAQLKSTSDRRILENGPMRDEMGAFGYLRNTAKWKNLNIRFRDFMPAGVRPVLIPVT